MRTEWSRQKIYHEEQSVLETGTDLIDSKIRYLIRLIVLEGGTEKIDLIGYKKNEPENEFVKYDHIGRSLTINLLSHYNLSIKRLCSDNNNDKYFYSAKFIILRDLFQSIVYHKYVFNGGNKNEPLESAG